MKPRRRLADLRRLQGNADYQKAEADHQDRPDIDAEEIEPQSTGKVGVLDPASGKTEEIALGPRSAPHGVIVGPDGAKSDDFILSLGNTEIVRQIQEAIRENALTEGDRLPTERELADILVNASRDGLIDAAVRGNVAIYPVDARGLPQLSGHGEKGAAHDPDVARGDQAQRRNPGELAQAGEHAQRPRPARRSAPWPPPPSLPSDRSSDAGADRAAVRVGAQHACGARQIGASARHRRLRHALTLLPGERDALRTAMHRRCAPGRISRN